MGKKQHYVPQFYLKNFSDVEQKCIGMYRFSKQEFVPRASVKSVAYRDNLYDDDDSLENALSSAESSWKEAIDIFLGKNVTSKTVDWLNEHAVEAVRRLLEFISVTEARTTRAGDSLAHMFTTLENKVGRDMLPETYNQYFGDMREFLKHPNLIPMQIAYENIQYFAGLDLLVIVNCTTQNFITSDVPVFNLNPYYCKRKYNKGFGLSSMGLQKFLTLSGNCCLCLYDRNAYKRNCNENIYFLRSSHMVNRMNQIIAENAYEQVFFGVNENENYIRRLCKGREIDARSSVIFHGKDQQELIQFHTENIWTPLYLPCFSIKKEAMKLQLPTHMGGLTRPELDEMI